MVLRTPLSFQRLRAPTRTVLVFACIVSSLSAAAWILSGKAYLSLEFNWLGFGPIGVSLFQGKIFWSSLITFVAAFGLGFYILLERQRVNPVAGLLASGLAVLSGAYLFEYAYLFLNHNVLSRYLSGPEFWFNLAAGLIVGFGFKLMRPGRASVVLFTAFLATMALWYFGGYPQLADKETLVELYRNYLGLPAILSLPLNIVAKLFATLAVVAMLRWKPKTNFLPAPSLPSLPRGLEDLTPRPRLRQTLFWGSLFLTVIFVLLYLKWMALWRWRDAAFYAYSVLVTSYILCRFGLAGLYKPPAKDPSYTPTVSVVIPVYNEEEEIEHTVRAWLTCDYPAEKYQVIVVNDGSKDGTWPILQRLNLELQDPRLTVDTMDRNRGKKFAQSRGFSHATGEIVVVADSDSFPQNPNAIREIVQPFRDPKIGGACGHTDVANTGNWLGKMQKLRYWSSFDRYKRSESVTGSVICLSGCFSAIRRTALDRVLDEWLRQSFLGRQASYGDDRALTTLLLKYGWDTVYVPSARAKTIVPETFKKFWNQQMRWEKSYIRETLIGSRFMWRRPLAAVEYYVGAFVTWGGFVVAAYTIWYRPIFSQGAFMPWVYLLGLTVVSMLYAINYRRYNKDALWVYAPIWGIIYAVVLIWRLPLAIIDLHKSDWKTR